MKSDPLDKSLADYAQQPLPACPDRLASNVWREIESRRRRSIWTRLFPLLDWPELFREPRLALSAAGLALAIGFVPALLQAKPGTEIRLARESLHFEVFSSRAPMAMLVRIDSSAQRSQP